MNDTILEFQNVSWQYAETTGLALDDVSFSIKKGELVGVIGINEAGKSSLCHVCNGLIPNSFEGELKGDILLNGKSIRKVSTAQLAQSVGSVFSDPEAQMSQITVHRELSFGPSNLEVPKQEILVRVEKILKLMNLEAFRDRSPFQLSGGEQQRVAIASVLTMNPELLVLDEPTSNLDPISTEHIFQVISQLNRETGMTVILVEHEIELLAQYVDRILVMHKGKVVLNGTPREVFSHGEVFREIGIQIPQVKQISDEAKKCCKSWQSVEDIITMDELYQQIKAVNE